MGYWLELRCENRDNPSANTSDGLTFKRCYSNDNIGPGELASDTRESVLEVWREIDRGAKQAGWVKTKYGWICPFCAKQPTVCEELEAMHRRCEDQE